MVKDLYNNNNDNKTPVNGWSCHHKTATKHFIKFMSPIILTRY